MEVWFTVRWEAKSCKRTLAHSSFLESICKSFVRLLRLPEFRLRISHTSKKEQLTGAMKERKKERTQRIWFRASVVTRTRSRILVTTCERSSQTALLWTQRCHSHALSLSLSLSTYLPEYIPTWLPTYLPSSLLPNLKFGCADRVPPRNWTGTNRAVMSKN